jgi:hypothetical protein
MIKQKIILTEEELEDVIFVALVGKTNTDIRKQAERRAKQIMENYNENNN